MGVVGNGEDVLVADGGEETGLQAERRKTSRRTLNKKFGNFMRLRCRRSGYELVLVQIKHKLIYLRILFE